MTRPGSVLAPLLSAALALGVMSEDEERPPVPADTLPVPLAREAPLGAAELAAGLTASDDEVELGRRLFFDPGLSRDGSIACASCHRPQLGFADDRARSLGVEGRETRRNTPSLLNKALSRHLFWDGRAATLEDQVTQPIEDPTEMGLGLGPALAYLGSDAGYVEAFARAYGTQPSRAGLERALAAFVRALTVGDSPVDRFREGDVDALTAQEQAGLWLYEGRAGCWRCHSGPNFSDEAFHNTGVGATDGSPEPGRGAITREPFDVGRFRTPGLRMLTRTAPYMHDGSLSSLTEVVEFYRRGGEPNANLSQHIKALELTDEDVQHLVAFLEALSR